MKYNPKKKSIIIPIGDVESVSYSILHALKKMRVIAGLPLTPFEKSGALTDHDHAAIAILDVAVALGLDLEVTPHNHSRLDLSDI